MGEPVVIAVDIGATNLRVALVAADGNILKKKSVLTTQVEDDSKAVIRQVIRVVKTLRLAKKNSLVAIGVSAAGPLKKDGLGFDPTNLPFGYVSVVTPLKKEFSVPVYLLNDTKAAVCAEHMKGHGNRGRKKNICYVTISSGIGCGAVVDGHILQGRDGSAGEMGHASVDVSFLDGRHDWEFYAAGKSILAFFDAFCISRGKNGCVYRSPKALYAAEKKDPMVKDFLREVGHVNAQGVHNVILAYNPDIIVFGGSVARGNWKTFIGGVRRYIRRDVADPLPKMVLTKLGDEISLIGAGLYAHKNYTEQKK